VQSELNTAASLPADLADLPAFIRLQLEGRTNLDEPSRELPDSALTLAEFRVTQAIQRDDGSSPLVASRRAYVDLLVDTEDGTAESVTMSVFAARDGVDMPGSPFTFPIKYNVGWGSSNVRSGPRQRAFPLPGENLSGEMSFRLAARQPILEAGIITESQQISFLETDPPVYWIVPVNTATTANPNLPGEEFLLRSEQEVRAVFPLASVDFVRRPPLRANPATAEDAIAVLNQYDQQVILAWTIGLLFTGEAPFALPDQIIGAFPADQKLDDFLGMSDPRWWYGGAGRVVWIKEVSYDAGLLLPHEINHNLDTNVQGSWGRHVMGCGSTGLDPQWPYPNNRIQEPGLVAEEVVSRNGQLLTPPLPVAAETPDYMSYCRASFRSNTTAREAYPYQWVSPHRWERQLLGVFAGGALSASATQAFANGSPVTTMAVDDMLYINGRVNLDGSGALAPILMQPGIPRAEQNPGAHELRLAGCDNSTLLTKSFAAGFENVEGQPRESATFAMVLPDPGGVCTVQLRLGDAVLAERTLSVNAPEVVVTAPNGGERWDGRHVLSWQAIDADGDPTSATILYSPDGGNTWLPVATGIASGEYLIDSSTLPGSAQALFRVLVTDGMNTAQDDSDAVFEVAATAPVVAIITPALDTGIRAGEALHLRGTARNTKGEALPAERFRWQLNGETIAIGNPVAATLEAGEQQVSLLVADDNGMIGQASVALNVAGSDADSDGVPDDEDSCPTSAPGSLVTVADCPTEVENVLYDNGCSLEEQVNDSLSRGGRDGLIALLKRLRKDGDLSQQDQKLLKKCVREEDQ
jgi:hypothetical protein